MIFIQYLIFRAQCSAKAASIELVKSALRGTRVQAEILLMAYFGISRIERFGGSISAILLTAILSWR